MTLTFYPKEPVPATFNIRYTILVCSTVVENFFIRVLPSSFSAVFSNEDGATCVTDLQPITIEFRDLFQPLPKNLLEKVPAVTYLHNSTDVMTVVLLCRVPVVFSSLNCGRAFLPPSYKSKTIIYYIVHVTFASRNFRWRKLCQLQLHCTFVLLRN